jgi:hypothetical protein
MGSLLWLLTRMWAHSRMSSAGERGFAAPNRVTARPDQAKAPMPVRSRPMSSAWMLSVPS